MIKCVEHFEMVMNGWRHIHMQLDEEKRVIPFTNYCYNLLSYSHNNYHLIRLTLLISNNVIWLMTQATPISYKRSIWCQNYDLEIIKTRLVHWFQDKGKNNNKNGDKKVVSTEQGDNTTLAECLQQDATNRESERQITTNSWAKFLSSITTFHITNKSFTPNQPILTITTCVEKHEHIEQVSVLNEKHVSTMVVLFPNINALLRFCRRTTFQVI